MYDFKAEVVRVIDADTIIVNIELGFSVAILQTVRLAGINAYETSLRDGTTKEQKVLGIEAKDFITKAITGKNIYIVTFKEKGKYGRYIGEVYCDKNLILSTYNKNRGSLNNIDLYNEDLTKNNESGLFINVGEALVKLGYAEYHDY